MKHTWLLVLVVGCAVDPDSFEVSPATDSTYNYVVKKDTRVGDDFVGWGAQFNANLYAEAGGVTPSTIPALESKVVALAPQHVRMFIPPLAVMAPTTAAGADQLQSFERTLQLAQDAGATVNVTWPGGYTGSGATFGLAQMTALAATLDTEINVNGHTALQYVTIQNEGNTHSSQNPCGTIVCRADMNQLYRTLDAQLRALPHPLRGPTAVHPIKLIGGDLIHGDVGQPSYYQGWLTYMAANMNDVLDGYSLHMYWLYWNAYDTTDSGAASGSGFAFLREAMAFRNRLPAGTRKPMYVTEFGVRGHADWCSISSHGCYDPTINPYPGYAEDHMCSIGNSTPSGTCTPMVSSLETPTQNAFFEVLAAQLGYVAALRWDAYWTLYGDECYAKPGGCAVAGNRANPLLWGAIGAPWNDWPLHDAYYVNELFHRTIRPNGEMPWHAFSVTTTAGAPTTLVTGFVDSDGGSATLLAVNNSDVPENLHFSGLAENSSHPVIAWNQDASSLGKLCQRAPVKVTASGGLTVAVNARSAIAITTQDPGLDVPTCR